MHGVVLNIRYDVKRFPGEQEYTFTVALETIIDGKNEGRQTLTDYHVYNYINENEANIQAKRLSKEYQTYFNDGLINILENLESQRGIYANSRVKD